MEQIDIMETRILIPGVLRCCLGSVATEFIDIGKVTIGQTSNCKHCNTEFMLTKTKAWLPTGMNDDK